MNHYICLTCIAYYIYFINYYITVYYCLCACVAKLSVFDLYSWVVEMSL